MEYDPSDILKALQRANRQQADERIMAAVGREAREMRMPIDQADVLCRVLLVMFGAEGKDVNRLEETFKMGTSVRGQTGQIHLEGFDKPKD